MREQRQGAVTGGHTPPSSPMERRSFIVQATCAGAAGVGLPWLRAGAAEERVAPSIGGRAKVRIGLLCPGHCAIPFVYANIQGIYKRYGLTTELVLLSSTAEIASGIASGDLQTGHIVAAIFLGAHKGIGPFEGKATPLVATQVTGTNGGVFAVARDRGIKSMADLKGRTIGAHSPLITHSILIKGLLKKHGLKPGEDVTLKTVHFRKVVTAMKEGEVDAFIHPEPLPTLTAARGVTADFMLTKDLWYKHPCCVLGMTRSFFEKEAETARALTLATTEAGLTVDDYRQRDAVIDLVHAKLPPYGKIPRQIYRKAFMPGRTDFHPFPYQSSAKVLMQQMKAAGLFAASVDCEAVARETFLSGYSRQILSELGAPEIPETNDREEILFGEKVT